MTCTEFQELSGLMAAGALNGAELAQAEAHLTEPRHEGCFEALQRASAGVEALARSLVPARPDERIWKNISARLEGAATPRVAGAAPIWRERLAWSAAAAAVLLLAATLSVRARDNRAWAAKHAAAVAEVAHGDEQRTHLDEQRNAAVLGATRAEEQRSACARELSQIRDESEAQKSALLLLQSPGTQIVSLAPPKGHGLSARALLNVGAKRGLLLSTALLPPAGRDYELWFIRGDKKIAAGLLHASASGTVLASIDPQIVAGGRPDAVAITLEPKGGAPQPTGPIVLVGALPKS